MRIGDTVKMRDEAFRAGCGELAGEVLAVGDATVCTVVFEHLRCVVWHTPVSDFEAVALPAPELH